MKTFSLFSIPNLLAALLLVISIPALAHIDKKRTAQLKEQTKQWMQNYSVQFIENKGQMADDKGNPVPYVLFKASASGMDMYITEKGLTYLFLKAEEEEHEKKNNLELFGKEEEIRKTEYCRIDVDLHGASIKRENIIKETPSVTDFNYFYPHCSEGIYGVRQYEKITINEIYPGIDWVLYNVKGFKYDFVVHPNADARHIKLVYCSQEPLIINSNGDLQMQTQLGTLTESAPVCYQNETEIPARFIQTLKQKNDKGGYDTHIQFSIDNYDNTQTLIIDPLTVPTLNWGTYYGGSGVEGLCSIDIDANGNVFATGYANTTSFPTLNPGSGTYFQGVIAGSNDIFILKFNNAGVLLWATYYGGSNGDDGRCISTDGSGNVFLTGHTLSLNLPVFNPGGGSYFQSTNAASLNAFILKFNNAGVRLWATYYGGTSGEFGYSIAIDASDNVFVTGSASSANLPTFNPGGGAYFQGTSPGGVGDIFLLKFSNAGVVLWATSYGGNGYEAGHSIAIDGNGNIFITGSTDSPNFPTLNAGGGAYFQSASAGGPDIFVLKFSNTGVLQWSTFYGGSGNEEGTSIDTDPASGNVFVTGYTWSSNFPTLNPGGGAYFQGTFAGGYDIFILKFLNSGVLDWATYYGGSGGEGFLNYGSKEKEIIVDAAGDVFVTGWTDSPNFPVLNSGGYFQSALSGIQSVFILQFANTGVLKWATYSGGNIGGLGSGDFGAALAIDPNGCLFATGEWSGFASNGLTNPGGGAYYNATYGGSDDSFIMKFCSSSTVFSITTTSTNLKCNGQCTGTATANPFGGALPYTYSWNTGGQTIQTATGLCAGSYVVTVTDASGATITATVIITQPTVLATTISSTSPPGGTATVNPSGGTGTYTYLWNTTPPQTTQTATDLATGLYCCILTDANSCQDTACVAVMIEDTCSTAAEFYLPNAFSPNNDGENDAFCLQGEIEDCIKELKIIIYDRWGEKVYESNDKIFCWDGTYHNKPMNTAVFVYYLHATLISEDKIIKQGNISLIK